jgi:muramoyltetrapeptide carboxypeptidase
MNLLQKGDTIRIVAPARKIAEHELIHSIRYLHEQGFDVDFGEHLFDCHHQYAGTDKQRALDFQQAMDNDSIKVIWCARGGYGSLRVIDALDFSRFERRPKWICGYSDITVFHTHINGLLQQPSLHATMPVHIQGAKADFEALNSMLVALQTGTVSYTTPAHPLNRAGKAKGTLCGGNLSVLYALNGSVSDLHTAGKILFIEDVDEYYYHLDRMMLCLKRSNKLTTIAALIVGGMQNMHDNAIPYGQNAAEIILEHCVEYDYPICFDFPAGHCPDNRALIMGGDATLDVDKDEVRFQITARE